MKTLSLIALLTVSCALPAAADALLSGTISSAAGEKMGGVAVSAKADGTTITTSVYTDETGKLLLPAAAARKIPGLGAGAVVRDRQGRGRDRRQQARGLHAQADDGFRPPMAATAR